MLNVMMMSVVMLSVVMLSVIMLNVVMLSVVAPRKLFQDQIQTFSLEKKTKNKETADIELLKNCSAVL
jgi:hypothetical protein